MNAQPRYGQEATHAPELSPSQHQACRTARIRKDSRRSGPAAPLPGTFGSSTRGHRVPTPKILSPQPRQSRSSRASAESQRSGPEVVPLSAAYRGPCPLLSICRQGLPADGPVGRKRGRLRTLF